MAEVRSAWPDHPGYRITVSPCRTTARAWLGELLLAESDRCLLLDEMNHVGRLYFPRQAVHWEHFERSDHHTVCPFKGRADYWHLTATTPPETNIVWAYPTPFPEVAEIADHVCFYQERVRVELEDGPPLAR